MAVEDGTQRFEPTDFGIGRLFWEITDAVVVADIHSEEIVLWNPSATRIFGYTSDEALGMALHRLVPERLRDAHLKGLARFRDSGTGALIDSKTSVELAGVQKGGAEVPIDLTLTAIRVEHDDDPPRYVIAMIRDVTERVRAAEAEHRIAESQALSKRAFELNDEVVQGLAVAKMALEVHNLEMAAEAVDRTLETARRLVTDLLSHSDIEAAEGSSGLQP